MVTLCLLSLLFLKPVQGRVPTKKLFFAYFCNSNMPLKLLKLVKISYLTIPLLIDTQIMGSSNFQLAKNFFSNPVFY